MFELKGEKVIIVKADSFMQVVIYIHYSYTKWLGFKFICSLMTRLAPTDLPDVKMTMNKI